MCRHLSLCPLQVLVIAFELDVTGGWAWPFFTTKKVGKSLFFRNSAGLISLRWLDILLLGGRDLNLNVKESVISRCTFVCLLFVSFLISRAALATYYRCANVGSLQRRQNPIWKPKQLRGGGRHQHRISVIQAPAGLLAYLPDHESLLERGQ